MIGSAAAADLPLYTKAPPPMWSWTGCYIGMEGGGAWGRTNHVAVTSPTPADVGLPITGNFNMSGGLFGGTVGCNYQFGKWVFGIEDDFSWTNKQGTANDIPPFGPATSQTSERWLDTLRGRIGVAWDRTLLYGTGGVAFADTSVSICHVTNGVCVNDAQTRTGWVVGAGIEYALWHNLFVKLEYLHVDLGTGRYISPPVVIAGFTYDTRDVRLTDDILRVGLNYRFNWAGPIFTPF
jgi:outer membrane immunogenic protein